MRTTLVAVLTLAFAMPVAAAPQTPAADFPAVGNAGIIVQKVMDRLDAQTDVWFHQGAYLRSAQVCRMHIAYDPTEMDSYFIGAWLLWSGGRDDEAQELFRQAAAANPDSYEPCLEAGLHWSGRRNYQMAALWLTEACSRGGGSVAWKALAHCYHKMGLIDQAIGAMRYAGFLDPTNELIPQNVRWLEEERSSASQKPDSQPRP